MENYVFKKHEVDGVKVIISLEPTQGESEAVRDSMAWAILKDIVANTDASGKDTRYLWYLDDVTTEV